MREAQTPRIGAIGAMGSGTVPSPSVRHRVGQRADSSGADGIDGFKMGSFTFKPGGRIKLDVIRDLDPIGSEDSFDPRTIPTDGSEGTNSQVHARETRLTLDMRGPVEGSELRMYVETDFYGSGNVLRLRQAFGSYKGLMAGQAWSTFVDDANFPNTIDFESPMAFPVNPAGAGALHGEAWRQGVVVRGGRRQQVIDHHARGRPGKTVLDARPDHAGQIRRVARARLCVGAFSAGHASARRMVSLTTSRSGAACYPAV